MTDGFEDRLWSDLVRDHGAQLATTPGARTTTRSTRPLLLGAGAASVATAATVLALALSSGPTPAYAVTSNSNGTVTVTIHDVAGVAGANAQLARLGVRARAVPAQSNCPPPPGRLPAAQWESALRPELGSHSITIVPSKIPAGDTLVLAARQTDAHTALGAFMVRGPVPACSDQAEVPGEGH
jgi:hypothetical protein